MEENAGQIAMKIRNRIKEKNFKRVKICAEMEKSVQWLTDIENMKYSPSKEDREKLEEILGIKIWNL